MDITSSWTFWHVDFLAPDIPVNGFHHGGFFDMGTFWHVDFSRHGHGDILTWRHCPIGIF